MGLREVFDRVADDYAPYAASPIHERLLARTRALLRGSLARGATILDVGCGPGTFAIPLAGDGFSVTAIDLSPRMIALVEASAKRAGVSVAAFCADAAGDLSSIPKHDAAIVIQGPLSYAADPLPIAINIASRVKTGGLLVFALARAASLEQLLRHPLRAAAPLLSRAPMRLEGELKGEAIAVYLHDPPRLTRRLQTSMDVIDHFAVGLSPRLPAQLDALLSKAPLLRRLGATTVYVARVRSL